MKRTIAVAVLIISLSVFVMPVNATIHPDISVGSWFKYDASITATPTFGIFQFSFTGQYNVSVKNISGNTVTTSVVTISSTLPFNASSLFSSFISVPTEALSNTSLTIGNVTVPFVSSIETDSTKYWRGIQVKTADLGSVMVIIPDMDATMKAKFDAVTGLLYEISLSATLNLGTISLIISMDISLTQANEVYRMSMLSRYDHSYDTQFVFSDVINAPWVIPTIILSIVLVILVVVLMSSRKQPVKQISTSKPKVTRSQERRSRIHSKVGRKK